MEVSYNEGTPKSSILHWDFSLTKQLLGYTQFMELPIHGFKAPIEFGIKSWELMFKQTGTLGDEGFRFQYLWGNHCFSEVPHS